MAPGAGTPGQPPAGGARALFSIHMGEGNLSGRTIIISPALLLPWGALAHRAEAWAIIEGLLP